MAGPSWLIDGNRFATKIKCASGTCDAGKIKWKSNPSRMCPSCHHTIDNSDVVQDWPGLPRGVKFDPTDQEIIQHLTAKSGTGGEKPHPFIDEFIPTVDEEDGICYTHPRNLPGVKQDGTASHFFHRTIKAYNTGTRKRRKIHDDDLGDVRWHKTGRTKPVSINGVQKGCKKIMVLYICTEKRGKPEKTNWVMHQYHLGTEEDEKDGDFIISKVFYQQQQLKQSDKAQGDISDATDDMGQKLDPVTPKSVTPERPGNESRHDPTKDFPFSCIGSPVQDQSIGYEEVHDMVIANEVKQHKTQEPETTKSGDDDKAMSAIVTDHEVAIANEVKQPKIQDPETAKSGDDDDDDKAMSATVTDDQVAEDNDNQGGEEILWDSESQYMLNSQQLVEGLSLCDDLLQSQSPPRDESGNDVPKKRSILSEYARLGPEDLKKDLEECQNLVLDPSNIDLDTPPEFRLSQLEFGSQESFGAWGLDKMCD